MTGKAVMGTNEILKSALVSQYKSFVDSVEPGEIVDILIQEKVMTTEEWNILSAKETRQDKCRFLLDKIFTTSNPNSCIALCKALKEYYPWIHDSICERIELQDNFSEEISSEDLRNKLMVYEEYKMQVKSQLKEKNLKIQELEAEIEDMKNKYANLPENGETVMKRYKEMIMQLQTKIEKIEGHLSDQKVENSNLNSHVMILENQLKASASRMRSRDNVFEFDDGACDSITNSKISEVVDVVDGVKIIYPEDINKINKLPKFCGSYFDLYNGRYGKECLCITIKELVKGTEGWSENRLKREASLTRKLNHPRLTKLLGASSDIPVSYIIYESSSIPNALNYLNYKPSQGDGDLMSRWCVQIACALEHIHKQRILVRNVRLENMLVVNEGTSVKLTNFEFAVQIPDGCICYTADSTPALTDKMERLAPEVWTRRQWFEATDVWSFALSAIKLFCVGAKLFPCKTERDIKSIIETEQSLADEIRCFKSIESTAAGVNIRQCLMRDHHLRPSISKLTSFFAFRDDVVVDCKPMKDLMVDTLVEYTIMNKVQVRSITTLNNFLYFLVNSSSSIKCYRMHNGYERGPSIKLGLSRKDTLRRLFHSRRHPQHRNNTEECITPSHKLISICGVLDRLFVLDSERCVVWKVAASKKRAVGQFKVPEEAVSIQCSSDRQNIVVFCKRPSVNGYSAVEYTLEGVYTRYLLRDFSQELPLQRGLCIDKYHTLVLCGQNESFLQLSVVDTDGTLSSGFGSLSFHNISDISIHQPSKCIFLADISKNRILLLNPTLQQDPLVVFGIEQGISLPSAIHVADDGSLYVGLVSGNVQCFHVKAFQHFLTPTSSTPQLHKQASFRSLF